MAYKHCPLYNSGLVCDVANVAKLCYDKVNCEYQQGIKNINEKIKVVYWQNTPSHSTVCPNW